jgi:hypothetical protein
MNNRGNIVWLASYPKSGNTWFRVFLSALLQPACETVDINNLHSTTIASSRQLFDELTGIASSDLSDEEIDRLRPLVYQKNAAELNRTVFHKIHDAYSVSSGDVALIPSPSTKAVLYFIRNPLDVAVSLANHLNTSIGKAIVIMNNSEYAFSGRTDRLQHQLRQRLTTWSMHVKSWNYESGLPVHLIHYEDMLINPFDTFSKALYFIELSYSATEIQAALEKSSFSKLKSQEDEKGFSEKNSASASFFRKGIAGDWKNMLTKKQVKQIIADHGEIMEKYGYLNNPDLKGYV